MKTRKASCVTPNVAGIESSAKSRSVDPIAIITRNSGVATRLPSMRVNSREPSYSSVTGTTRRTWRTTALSSGLGSSSRWRSRPMPVQMRIAPKTTNVNENAASAAAPIAMKTARKISASTTPTSSTRWW